jgi:hypothetical protein
MRPEKIMQKKYIAACAAIVVGLTLTGCSTTPPDTKPSSSASPTQSQIAEQVADSLYPGGMPKKVDPSTVTNLEIVGGINDDKAKEVYAWVASFAALSFNDSTLQQMETFREFGLMSFSQYFTGNGLKTMEKHFSEYAKKGDYASLDDALQMIGHKGLVTVLPSKGYTFLNSPVFDKITYGDSEIVSAENIEGLPAYTVTIPVTARLLWIDPLDNQKYETVFYRTFEVWVLETGDVSSPYLIDSWTENPLAWEGKKTE